MSQAGLSDLQIEAVSVELPCQCDTTELMLRAFICSAGYKGLSTHTNTCWASAVGHRHGYQCPPACCCTFPVCEMARFVCSVHINMLLWSGLARWGCVVVRSKAWQQRNVSGPSCVLGWRRGSKGQMNDECLATMTCVHQMSLLRGANKVQTAF